MYMFLVRKLMINTSKFWGILFQIIPFCCRVSNGTIKLLRSGKFSSQFRKAGISRQWSPKIILKSDILNSPACHVGTVETWRKPIIFHMFGGEHPLPASYCGISTAMSTSPWVAKQVTGAGKRLSCAKSFLIAPSTHRILAKHQKCTKPHKAKKNN